MRVCEVFHPKKWRLPSHMICCIPLLTVMFCFSVVPHAKPLQSWSLSTYDGTVVPGSPSLSAHGEVSAVANGLHFDGATSSLDTYLEDTNCLHDPELCSRGLSFGVKLRLDKEVNDYTEPKFILDTGGHGKNTRGVALFVENRKLVAEVTTKNMRYRVS